MERLRRVLFVDIDGVLHRGDSYAGGGRIVSSAPGRIELFEYVPLLDSLLGPYPEVEVVLSSDWSYRFGIEHTRNMLPRSLLRTKVTAATYQGCEDEWRWPRLSRGAQVLDYVRRHSLNHWLAVDDRKDGFERYRDRLIHCQTEVGLGDLTVVEQFRSRLHERFAKPTI
ncbi:HAD domain-containing protein [Paraburkholderia sediminicola]|uniref:HAD domain-containing protein n=2 Tax=Paraburkholderia TaxID=1822464 RepID=UPI0038B7CBC9